MLKKMTVFALAALFVIAFSGCQGHTTLQPESRVEKNWGRSFEAAKHNQILNPGASGNLEPVEGLDGYSAERIMDGYFKGERPAKAQRSGGLGALTVQ